MYKTSSGTAATKDAYKNTLWYNSIHVWEITWPISIFNIVIMTPRFNFRDPIPRKNRLWSAHRMTQTRNLSHVRSDTCHLDTCQMKSRGKLTSIMVASVLLRQLLCEIWKPFEATEWVAFSQPSDFLHKLKSLFQEAGLGTLCVIQLISRKFREFSLKFQQDSSKDLPVEKIKWFLKKYKINLKILQCKSYTIKY